MKNKTIPLLPSILILCWTALPGCTPADSGGTVSIMGTWGGNELQSFRSVCRAGGVRIRFETTRDLDALLTARSAADNLPHLAVLPNPAYLRKLAAAGKLVPLEFLDQAQLDKDYAPFWKKLGSYGGRRYGVFYKIANKSLIWYNPTQFKKFGQKIPQTWNQLLDVSKKISAAGGPPPWSIGADIGWPLSDWIENILVRSAGPQVYRKWVTHRIPWTAAEVKRAFRIWGGIITNRDWLEGDRDGTLAASFQAAACAPFETPARAFFHFSGDFIGNIVRRRIPNLKAHKTIAFFPFPEIDKRFGKPVVGGADVLVCFRTNRAAIKLLRFLATARAHRLWVKRGGFISHNRTVPLSAYQDPLAREAARMVRQAPAFVFDASDMMPPAVGNQGGFWDACKQYLQDPTRLDAILGRMERMAARHY